MGKLASENDCLSLPVAEEFYSVQGEGCNTGRAAYFIRLAGCDVRCSFCDSKATWNVNLYKNLSPVAEIADLAIELDIIHKSGSWFSYGGEKLAQGLAAVKQLLRDNPELCEEIEAQVREGLATVKD